ncbi:response regulator [Streptomyces sp. Tu 2975]|uniref:response regulator transcription factor n=1 Tax=Streptomyces sp. Tu 2975 TaxID=2676871 RepID=UPI001358D79F|nr:response regulator transcription factor [Streptomyces sp. Tu 2975]QIP83735.1 response regulator [Streptomyces sp. Tu 2975]
MRVLLIEDDDTIAEPLAEGLARYGLAVERFATGAEALGASYGDIVLLDLGLPDIDGIDVCRRIRQVSDVPIIMLTARGGEADRIVGLEIGADDYLAKPFSIRELIARVRAVTRRTAVAAHGFTGPPGPARPATVTALPEPSTGAPGTDPAAGARGGRPSGGAEAARSGGLVVDRRTRQVRLGTGQVALTPKEFDLLALLAEDPGAVYTRRQIIDQVWDPHFHGPTRTLDVHVATLRRKLGDARWIETVRGVGFRLTDRVSHPGPAGAGGRGPVADRVRPVLDRVPPAPGRVPPP